MERKVETNHERVADAKENYNVLSHAGGSTSLKGQSETNQNRLLVALNENCGLAVSKKIELNIATDVQGISPSRLIFVYNLSYCIQVGTCYLNVSDLDIHDFC